jgi:hypothetical protein
MSLPTAVNFSGILWSKVLFLLFTWNTDTAVLAQSSSCISAQRLQAELPSEGEITMDSTDIDLCGSGTDSFSDSELQAGHWFSYVTSLAENRITHIQVQCSVTGCDAMSGEIAPIVEIFRGPCDSLTCEDISSLHAATDRFFENEVGVEYFIYVYTLFALGGTPYVLSFDEIEPPSSDNMDGAIALTSQDLPYKGSFTTFGARSDLDLDACGLDGGYGVWFTYKTTWPSQSVVLRATDNLGFSMTVGVQVANGNHFSCIAYSVVDISFLDVVDEIEWIAESGNIYFILVASPSPEYSGAFELTVQSRGDLQTPANTSIPGSPVPAPAAFDQTTQVTTAPTIRLVASGDSKFPSSLPSDSSSISRGAGAIFNSTLTPAILACLVPIFSLWF